MEANSYIGGVEKFPHCRCYYLNISHWYKLAATKPIKLCPCRFLVTHYSKIIDWSIKIIRYNGIKLFLIWSIFRHFHFVYYVKEIRRDIALLDHTPLLFTRLILWCNPCHRFLKILFSILVILVLDLIIRKFYLNVTKLFTYIMLIIISNFIYLYS